MHLVWHVLLKDLSRLRLPLAVWAAIQLLAQLGPNFIWSMPTRTPGETEFLLYTLAGIQALSFLAAFDFATRLIQEDSAARTDAFWRTRPISGLRLLATKLFCLIAFTGLATIPALLVATITAQDSSVSTFERFTTLLQPLLILAALAVPFAAFTRSFRQNLVFSLLGYGSVFVLIAGVYLIYDPGNTDLHQPRVTLAKLITLFTLTAALINQYNTGRLARSLRFAGIGAIVVTLVLAFWPWRFPLIQTQPPSTFEESPETRAITIAYEKSVLWNEAEFGPKSLRPVLNLDFTVSGFPSGYFLRRKAIYHHWRENTAPSRPSTGTSISPAPDPRIILGLTPSNSPLSSIDVQSQIPAAFSERLRSSQPSAPYQADIVFDLLRAEITEIPLIPGQTTSTPEGLVRILTLEPSTATLHLLERGNGSRSSILSTFTDDYAFILYNRRTGEVLRGSGSSVVIPSIKHHELRFAPLVAAHPYVIGSPKPFTDEFLRDARLVKISFPKVGTFARTVEVSALRPKLLR